MSLIQALKEARIHAENFQATYDELRAQFDVLNNNYELSLSAYKHLSTEHDALSIENLELRVQLDTLRADHKNSINCFDALSAEHDALSTKYEKLRTALNEVGIKVITL